MFFAFLSISTIYRKQNAKCLNCFCFIIYHIVYTQILFSIFSILFCSKQAQLTVCPIFITYVIKIHLPFPWIFNSIYFVPNCKTDSFAFFSFLFFLNKKKRRKEIILNLIFYGTKAKNNIVCFYVNNRKDW